MPIDFRERHVVITGASGGLGGAVVDAFADAGAICHLPSRGQRASGEKDRQRVDVVSGVDLTSEAAVASFYAKLPPLWASIHLAGGFTASPVVETSLETLRSQLDINLTTAFLCCREAIRNMRKASPSNGGRIVNVSARTALVPTAGMVAYSASKAAVVALTQSLAEEVKAEQIWVNAVAPSLFDTPTNRAAMPKANHDRWPKPTQIARAILWLASSDNELTTGAVLPVYGG